VLVEGVTGSRSTPGDHHPAGRTVRRIVTQEASIHVSNVMVVDSDGKPTRIGRRKSRARTARSGEFAWPGAPERSCDGHRHGVRPKCNRAIDSYGETASCRGSRSGNREEIAGKMRDKFAYANVMQIPGVVKVVVNMGVGEAARDSKLIDGAVRDLGTITGQRPEVRKATKSIAQFKLREGMPDRRAGHPARRPDVGVPGSLADHRAAPNPDFAGSRRRSSTATATTRSGLNEQSMFPRDQSGLHRPPAGMDITVVTSASTNDEGRSCCGSWASRSRRADQLMAKKGLVNKAAQKPKFAVRVTPAASGAGAPVRCCASLGCAGSASARWRTGRAARSFQVVLVTTSCTTNVVGPERGTTTRKVTGHHDDDRPDRGHAHSSAQRQLGVPRPGRDAAFEAQGRDRRDPPARGLHRFVRHQGGEVALPWWSTSSTAQPGAQHRGPAPGVQSPACGCTRSRPICPRCWVVSAWRSSPPRRA